MEEPHKFRVLDENMAGRIEDFLTNDASETPKRKKVTAPTTLEAHHHKKLREFDEAARNIASLEEQLAKLEAQLAAAPVHSDEWCLLSDQIRHQQKQIDDIRTDKCRIDYFLDVGDIVFQYQDAQEAIAKGTAKRSARPHTRLKNSIMNFFETETEETPGQPVAGAGTSTGTSDATTGGTKASNINTADGLNRDKMLEKFLSIVEPEAIRSGILPGSGIEPGWGSCSACGAEMRLFQNEAVICCPSCGLEEPVLIDSEKPSYKDPPREITYFAYKKINHFNEWLAQFQAKENTDIPPDVLEAIMAELRKQRITDPKKIKADKIREVLQKLKLSKMYDHVQQIKNLIQNQMTNLTLSKEMEEKLQHMFKEIQPAFIKYCPKGRSNFLSYPFVLYKMCQLLEMDEFLPCFQLLKSREKLFQQDQVWQKICADMRWQFIKSI